jgi:membrane protease subunit HflC
MNRKRFIPIVLVFLAGVVLSQAIFYVNENETALVLELGKVVGDKRASGLNTKIPFIQRAVFLDKRILSFLIPKTIGLSSDLKPFEIDSYVCWRIVHPRKFVESLRSQEVAADRLRSIVYSALRSEIGNKTLQDVVGAKRRFIMETVLQNSNKSVAEYGVEIVDVRVKRSDLPNRQAIFARMNAEREKMANQYRAEGESASRDIRSDAERERDTTLAEASRQSTVIRGQADAAAIQTLNKAIASAPDFYDFLKSLEVYRKAFRENSKVVFSSNDPLLQVMR